MTDTSPKMQTFCVFLLLLYIKCNGVCGLRHVRVWSPQAVERGGDASLRCLYDLEADSLYSVKWYRGDREFCRYSPREVPPLKVFPLPGIDVDMSESDAERLTLRGVTHAAAGRYTCEVSADAPSFHTAQVNTTLAVVDLPTAGPTLRGIKPRYRAGARLHADCACRDSQPAANLSFYINDLPALPKHVRHHVIQGEGGLLTATASINFILQPRHFINGKLKVRCTASIYMLYWRSTEKSCVEEQGRRSTEAPALPDQQRVALVFPVQGQASNQESNAAASSTRCQMSLALISAAMFAALKSTNAEIKR